MLVVVTRVPSVSSLLGAGFAAGETDAPHKTEYRRLNTRTTQAPLIAMQRSDHYNRSQQPGTQARCFQPGPETSRSSTLRHGLTCQYYKTLSSSTLGSYCANGPMTDSSAPSTARPTMRTRPHVTRSHLSSMRTRSMSWSAFRHAAALTIQPDTRPSPMPAARP